MPGTPATTPRFALPRYSDADAASFSAQVNAISDRVDATAAKVVPVVTSLPSSPADGDEIYYLANASQGVVWHFRYRVTSNSAYKWEFVGGGSLYSRQGSPSLNQTLASSALAAISVAGCAQITAPPFAGDYEYDISLSLLEPALTGPYEVSQISLVDKATSSYFDAAGYATAGIGALMPQENTYFPFAIHGYAVAVPASTVLAAGVAIAGVTSALSLLIYGSTLRIRPIRVG